MTTGTGLAILGLWIFAGLNHLSNDSEGGKSVAVAIAICSTALFILL